ncbi:Rrf2 family transcriptional regulator [Arcobacter sp. F2176]|uniref:RrF2 family transcriptional regulator n=1 Tax=unclassified Arcobacter TaxID=2593671 RepID=UPI00100A9159|nr:Rrf2 family transcriptional regulator [Arcobacter sp. F2176]RXJ80202.1 transcriptional regulator, BadM/Rrf2 family protein [Arcobacter sp. F2176]
MQLHNTSQYAIRILSYITNQKKESLLNAKELSENLSIPYKFLTKIMGELVRTGLIKSIRGREGGYELNKAASDIKISDILDIFNDSLQEERCILGIGHCDCLNKCALHDQWIQPKSLIEEMFKETTLDKLANNEGKI